MDKDETKNLENTNKRLFRLRELDDYEVADNDPDIRGWDVIDAAGAKIGEVDDLIVDPNIMKVRYLDVKAEDELATGDGDRHLIIPIGAANLDDDDDNVHLRGISRNSLEKYPAYQGGPISYDFEHSLRETLHGLDATKPDLVDKKGEDFYNTDMYDENAFYGNRRIRNREE